VENQAQVIASRLMRSDTRRHQRPSSQAGPSWSRTLLMIAALAALLFSGSAGAKDKDGDELVNPDPVVRTHADHEQVFVASGAYLMGLPEGKGQAHEQPQHRVWVSDFWIDRAEVTNALYRACVAAGKCTEPKKYYQGDEHPVVYVDWDQAVAYCEYREMRLPTEAEWEKAATWCPACLDPEHKRTYPWGNGWPTCDRTVMDDDEFGCGKQATHPVGSKPSGDSAYGAHDMAGNAWEWAADWFDAGAYVGHQDAANPTGPETGESRVLRGGSWATKSHYLRAAGRLKYLPPPTTQDVGIGFRCAVEGDGPAPPPPPP
jgi:formylglycine-generating enzyme required for sulfatase activity